MNVSAITLDILDAAVVNTLTDASPAEQGQLLADLIIKFHGEQQAEQPPEPKPLKRVKVKHNPKVAQGQAQPPEALRRQHVRAAPVRRQDARQAHLPLAPVQHTRSATSRPDRRDRGLAPKPVRTHREDPKALVGRETSPDS